MGKERQGRLTRPCGGGMINIHIICTGKLKEAFYVEAAAEYTKRLRGYCKLQVTELPEERLPASPSRAQIDAALAREAAAIRTRLPPRSSVVALCVEGRPYSSEELSQLMETWTGMGTQHLAFVIGGSHGLHQSLKADAWVRLSMSPMTFPHHLARIMLLEQIYRGFKIMEGGRYHK